MKRRGCITMERGADAWALRVEAAFGPALWTEAAFPHWLDAWAKRKGLF